MGRATWRAEVVAGTRKWRAALEYVGRPMARLQTRQGGSNWSKWVVGRGGESGSTQCSMRSDLFRGRGTSAMRVPSHRSEPLRARLFHFLAARSLEESVGGDGSTVVSVFDEGGFVQFTTVHGP